MSVTWTVRCPSCSYVSQWAPQATRVVVRCYNREITGTIRTAAGLAPQRGAQIYATTDRSRVWMEGFLVDGPDREPKWWCRTDFIVRPTKEGEE